jgi:bisphosphoglycerate-independent phosphoglycerate mutase (AlkP superfamily)
MKLLRNATLETCQSKAGRWYALARDPRNGRVVLATKEVAPTGYESEQEAIDALLKAYRRSIGG